MVTCFSYNASVRVRHKDNRPWRGMCVNYYLFMIDVNLYGIILQTHL